MGDGGSVVISITLARNLTPAALAWVMKSLIDALMIEIDSSSPQASYGDADRLYVTTCQNPRWAPILHLAEALRLKLPEGDHEWISTSDLCSLLESHGFQVEHAEGRMLVPKRVPFFSAFVNRLTERRDWLRPICLIQIVTFRQKVGYSPA